MKILHYCPSEMGNRHYKKTEKELKRLMESFSGRYFVYRYAKPYKAMLEKRVEKNDILLTKTSHSKNGLRSLKTQ